MEKQWVAGRPSFLISRVGGAIPLCQGCQHGTASKVMAEAVEEMGVGDDAIIITGVGCSSGIIFQFSFDGVMAAHGRPPDAASAVKRCLGGRPIVITYQGDGDCISIGTEPLIQAASRAERITVIMANNANYGTTGGQMAPTSIMGQVTTTSPEGRGPRQGYPIDTAQLLVGIKGVAYSARGALTSAAEYQRTKNYIKRAIQKQKDDIGFSFVEILVACPPNWRLSPLECLDWIEQKMIATHPLGEFKNVDKLD